MQLEARTSTKKGSPCYIRVLTMKILFLSRELNKNDFGSSLELFGSIKYEASAEIETLNSYDLAISYCYDWILKNQTIGELGCRIVNVHPSLLPYGRGIYPILWASAEDTPFGCTIHTIETSAIDSGRIILQRQLELSSSATLRQAHAALLSASRSLLLESLVSASIFMPESKMKLQDPSIQSVSYRSRKQSDYLFSRLPLGWDTSLGDVRRVYLEL